jgi:hypothetical protein
MPEIRINSLNSRAMNCGPLSEIIRGFDSCFRVSCPITNIADVLVVCNKQGIDATMRLQPCEISLLQQGGTRDGKTNHHFKSSSGNVLCFDFPAVKPHSALRNRQTETDPARRTLSRFVEAKERSE